MDDVQVSVGRRIQLYRERSGKTREVVGGLVGRSAEWVKSVEKGRILPPRLPMLEKLAGVLRCSVTDLLGDEAPQLQMLAGPGHAALPDVRAALNEYRMSSDARPVDLDQLAGRAAAAWRTRHSSADHRTALGVLLPALIRDTRDAVRFSEGTDRSRAQAVAANVLGLTQMFVAYQPAAELLWRTADRAMAYATDSGDVHAIGGAAWFLVEALRDSGDWTTAMTVGLDAIDVVERHAGRRRTDVVAMLGSLHLVTALTAARAGEDGRAWSHWDQADRIADRLPATYIHPWTWFSRPVLGFYAVSLAVELRKSGEALRQASRVEPSSITSRPRRARHLIEVARGHQLRADTAAMVSTLRDAHVAAPETVRFNGYARQMALGLLESRVTRDDARDLAVKIL